MLGHLEKLWYSYHDLIDIGKFSEFAKKVYLDTMGIGPFGEPINQESQWVVRLAKIGILGLLDIPHLGRCQHVNNYVKKLMEVTHEGYMWLEQIISIDVDLIAYITRIPSRGDAPSQFLEDKMKEKALDEEIKNKYGTKRGSCLIIIKHISDAVIRIDTKNMACKLIRK
jgi:hypothetical protein